MEPEKVALLKKDTELGLEREYVCAYACESVCGELRDRDRERERERDSVYVCVCERERERERLLLIASMHGKLGQCVVRSINKFYSLARPDIDRFKSLLIR